MCVKAAGINFAELMARQGMYDAAPKLPSVLGYEAAGDVVAVGPGVTDHKVKYHSQELVNADETASYWFNLLSIFRNKVLKI